ncbi:hypothetical protein TNIN_485051 [Trichonephila inaurata madagascariensis]|uniref:Uncharacterized protein n=1 Tax=Trichonephila inaurata madagascariensis TaxID=2747483 RepID=A0A8X6MDU7_9ARAC|nr:hypothetical protein TNIN_485051 [Trichonephila inaurata madagascariensis]
MAVVWRGKYISLSVSSQCSLKFRAFTLKLAPLSLSSNIETYIVIIFCWSLFLQEVRIFLKIRIWYHKKKLPFLESVRDGGMASHPVLLGERSTFEMKFSLRNRMLSKKNVLSGFVESIVGLFSDRRAL